MKEVSHHCQTLSVQPFSGRSLRLGFLQQLASSSSHCSLPSSELISPFLKPASPCVMFPPRPGVATHPAPLPPFFLLSCSAHFLQLGVTCCLIHHLLVSWPLALPFQAALQWPPSLGPGSSASLPSQGFLQHKDRFHSSIFCPRPPASLPSPQLSVTVPSNLSSDVTSSFPPYSQARPSQGCCPLTS